MMNTRRKSYIVKVLNGQGAEREYLMRVYDPAYIDQYVAARGWTLVSKSPKPRAKPRAAKWKLNDDALAQAVEFLGLKHPVYFTRNNTKTRSGSYSLRYGWTLPATAPARFRQATLVHRIQLRPADTAEDASRTLWHELAHAMQAERSLSGASNGIGAVGVFAKAVRAEAAIPYKRRPSEIEAREYEAFHDEMPLMVSA